MHLIALTGGIASGKSTACQVLRGASPRVVVFECDACVRSLLDNDIAVAQKIAEVFGKRALDDQGKIDRAFLREEIFSDDPARLRLELILHPRVMKECLDCLEDAAKQGAELFVADVPLLFEKEFDFGQTQVIVVASSRATQIERLKARNGFDDSLIESILQAQLPVEEKMSRADIVFWNEGPPAVLKSQIYRYFTAFPYDHAARHRNL